MHEPQVIVQNFPVEAGIFPVADAYNGDPDTDVISLDDAGGANFLLFEGAGGTGTVKIVAEACDDTVPTNTTAINFAYQVRNSGGQFGALARTSVASDGYTTEAGANKIVSIYIDARDLPEGKPYVRLNLTEVANSPCAAAIIVILTEPGYRGFPMPSALT